MESYALRDGWYTDGERGNIDYYVPFAFHTYGLILARSGLGDRFAAERYTERARRFAPQFRHWFAADGAAFPFGRSQTYRFAQGSFWGALAHADVDALAWGEVRGLALRHLRWWAERPISDRDGVLSVGYSYDNRRMSESYNSAGSPYWAMKAFWMLATPDEHPFWTEPERPADSPASLTLPVAGMVLGHDPDQVVALVAQGSGGWAFVEEADAKYEKFAYSSLAGFSGDFTPMFAGPVTDSMLALTDSDTGQRHVRQGVTLASVGGGVACARWEPFDDVRIDTLLTGGAPWHVRIHRIETARRLDAVETGFALRCVPDEFARPAAGDHAGSAAAMVTSPWGASVVVDLTPGAAPGESNRSAGAAALAPNANVMAPHTMVPMLTSTLEPGTHLIVCAVGVSPRPDAVDPGIAPAVSTAMLDQLERFAAAPKPDDGHGL